MTLLNILAIAAGGILTGLCAMRINLQKTNEFTKVALAIGVLIMVLNMYVVADKLNLI